MISDLCSSKVDHLGVCCYRFLHTSLTTSSFLYSCLSLFVLVPNTHTRLISTSTACVMYCRYSLADASFSGRFSLDSDTGILTASVVFLPSAIGQIEFRVVATKRRSNGTQQSAMSTVRIALISTEPTLLFDRISPYVFNVSESVAVKTEVGRVTSSIRLPSSSSSTPATTFVGATSSALVLYSFVEPQNDFSLDENTGRIFTRNILDRELIPMYSFSVKATVTSPAQVTSSPTSRSLTLSATTLVIFNVIDVNDNAPLVTFPTPSNNSIYVPYDLAAGGLVTKVSRFALLDSVT